MQLSQPIEAVKGVGEALKRMFHKLGVYDVGDLLAYYPRAYEDYSNVEKISAIKPGQVTIRVTIKQVKGRYIRGGLHITEAVASDNSGNIRITWFNQPYRANAIKSDTDYYVSGLFEFRKGHLGITNPSMELVSAFPTSTARIVPVYRETKGLTSFQIRKTLRSVMQKMPIIDNVLPEWMIKDYGLINKADAYRLVHFPNSQQDVEKARARLGFEELFELILASLLIKESITAEKAVAIPFSKTLARQFVANLPFKLTDAQRKVVWKIYQDIEKSTPMNRLVEGDVGSGKTVVAAMAAVMVMAQNSQVAFMAPTELLARQHAETLYQLLKPLGLAESVNLLVGGMKRAQKDTAHASIKEGKAQLLVGTHALIQEKVDMHKLALAIVDEQHRFGVAQRKKLLAKAGHTPHMLSMTATPIPRSLALTVYGELDVSVLDQKPADRKPIITKLVPMTDRLKVYAKIKEELDKGRQMFVVCPLIEESDMLAVRSAERTYKEISEKDFKSHRAALLHGKMKAEDKQRVMQQFLAGEIDILVATTVIEVGVDVPNATIMLIEAPERFGLAQMHQLRGRVGRSMHQGYCYLMLSDSKPPSKRLRAIERTHDGFKLAELDLELRGPGAIYGTLQHGQLDLRIANFTDTKLVAQARQAAQTFIAKGENLVQYPQLHERITQLQTVVHLN